jgi:hypothetical protein
VRTLPAALTTHLNGDVTRITTCWKITRVDAQVFGFTAHDRDIVYSGVTFVAASGITPSPKQGQTKLAVDNLEAIGILDSEQITDEDIAAGIWDHAYVEVYLLDWNNPANTAEPIHAGHIGEVRTERGKYSAELRGLADAYSQTIGQIYQPSCRAQFCDSRCGLDPADFTVTGTLDDVSANGLVLFDAARAEAGPTGGKAITGITKAVTPSVTCVGHGFAANQVVMIAGVLGMTEINGLTLKVKTVANADTFTLYGVDSTAFGNYASGGTATPQGDVGYFDGGVITMTTGASAGLSMEVKSYAPGTITLQLALPFGVGAGDAYSMIAGCGKRFDEDCVDRYDNGINFRGEPHVPGMDRLLWVGGQER